MTDDDFEAWLTSAPLASRLSEERIEVILNAIYARSEQIAEDLVVEGLERAWRAHLAHEILRQR